MRAYAWLLVAAYDGPYGPRGTIISRHTTYRQAEKAERCFPDGAHNWLRIVEVGE